jgi:gallate dioxygenase
MARIIGAIGASHTPTIGFAQDAGKHHDPVWRPIFEAFAPLQDWLAEQRPDAMVIVYNDHVTSFFFDHYSAFTLGIDTEYHAADEGGGPRRLPVVPGHAALSRHIGASLMADEFDLSFFQHRPLDHGCLSPLAMLWPHADGRWPGAIVPLQVGVLQFPIPSARRCWKLGQALRRAIESFPEDLKVVIVGTGGLSHQVHGERCGFNAPDWDREFLDLIETDPERLAAMTIGELAERGGVEGAEVIMWLVMRGALSPTVKRLHRAYYLPSMTGIATVLFEDTGGAPDAEAAAAHRAHVARELAGVERLDGSYPFDHARSTRAYRLNAYLHEMVVPAHRDAFLADPQASFEAAGLSQDERVMLRTRDWRGLVRYGAIFFGLEKLAAVVGVPNAVVYAGMKGMSLAEFQATRNAPGAVYSVAGDTSRIATKG